MTNQPADSADRARRNRVRVRNQKFYEPAAMWLMILGIAFLCQPWFGFLHAWSVAVMLVGLIAFNVAVHIPPPEPDAPPGDGIEPATPHEVVRGLSDG